MSAENATPGDAAPCTATTAAAAAAAPKRAKASDLTRDQRRDIRLLYSIGWSYKQIQDHYAEHKPTIRQIKYTCRASTPASPKKRCGRPSTLTPAQVDELVAFVCASPENRQMSFARLAEKLDFGVKKDAIRAALAREGFHRRLAPRKPLLTERTGASRTQRAPEPPRDGDASRPESPRREARRSDPAVTGPRSPPEEPSATDGESR